MKRTVLAAALILFFNAGYAQNEITPSSVVPVSGTSSSINPDASGKGTDVWSSIVVGQDVPQQNDQEAANQKKLGFTAHCYCKVTATPLDGCGQGGVVANISKGGYIGCPECEPKCKDYCRGVWDGTTEADKAAWAKQVTSCGRVQLVMTSSCGTCDYDDIGRSETINLGGHCVTHCDCAPGLTFDPNDNNCKKPLCSVTGVPDQSLGSSFFVFHGVIYEIGTKTNCKTHCQ